MYFDSPRAMRDWLEANHATAAQDVGMCFGWVDSVSRRVDDTSYMPRFTPRRPRSNWTPGNVARAQELIAEGLMHPSGLETFERRAAR